MKLFAVADLHLSGSSPKPMNIFGEFWDKHWDKISEDWRLRVAPEDLVLIGGDISWAMQLEEAVVDLEAIAALPGTKVLLKGNHDYWWSSLTKVRTVLPENMLLLQNNAYRIGDYVICGSRGWNIPTTAHNTEQDKKIFNRELQRLELSLREADRLSDGPAQKIALLHFPPFDETHEPTQVTALLKEHGIRHVFYGHLHGEHARHAFEGDIDGIRYHMVSCDRLAFRLYGLEEEPCGSY